MTTKPRRASGVSADREPLVPRRALVVGPTAERAAVLAPYFDALHIVAPGDVNADVLAGSGEPFACVAITGIPVDGGALAELVRRVRNGATVPPRIVIDMSDDTGRALLADASPLAGLVMTGWTDLAGVPVAVLEPAPDTEAVPQIDSDARSAPATPPVGAADAFVAVAESRELRERVAALERQLGQSTAALDQARAERDAARLRNRRFSGRAGRLASPRALLAAGALIAAAAVVLLVGWAADLGRAGYWLTAALELVLLMLAYLVRGQRWAGRRAVAAARHVRRVDEVATRRHQNLRKNQAALLHEVKRLNARLDEATVHLRTVRAQVVDGAAQAVPGGSNAGLLTITHQTQALVNLFALARVERPVPLMGGWAASPDVVLLLVNELLETRPRLVVECGSGVSTLWLALVARDHGLDTRIVALEHLPAFAEQTRAILRAHGVEQFAEVRDAPLVPTGLPGHATPWYDRAALDGLEGIGLLFVDGPPESTGHEPRFPAVPMLKDRFAPSVTIVLDDLVRESEQNVARAWRALLPDFAYRRVALDKDAAFFRRSPQPPAE